MELSSKIREMRKLKHLKQEDLANICCVTRSAISNWEAGRRRPDWDNLIVLAKLFGVTIEELVGDELIYYENPEINTVSKKSKKLFYIVPIVSSAIAIIIIIILLILLLPKDKENQFDKTSVSNIINISLQIKTNEQRKVYYFKESNELTSTDSSVYRLFELKNVYIGIENFSRYQFGFDFVFLLNISFEYNDKKHVTKFDSSKYLKINNDNNSIQFLPENNIPIITIPGTYDIIILVDSNNYFIGVYKK